MHGRAGEDRKKLRHMWTGPSRANLVVAGDVSSSSSSLSLANNHSFYKDGRKISVGDCALFKPPQDSPPFIGIIRWLTTGKENKLKLGVNWLYRPAEVKLGKGILLEAAPNELFYSFHKDEIPAVSLLHPCKVAFLPKGVELPSGICSFVCRRVYDITNRCLWWLTDQDYINERQEEVDQLLYKTRIEMHGTVQSGGQSPKPTNGPNSTSQLKPSSDSVQNSPSLHSQVKGKKRERGDQCSEPVKRERSSKMEDGETIHSRPESIWRSEIAKFTEKGGLVNFDGVEKLVQLMLPPEGTERKIDLVVRSLLAGVVAATDKFDCLNRFVHRGLPVFDEWLQEVHKGKIGDGSGSKDSEKAIEEFLIVLLRALDKLPVNLHALQMCNIGKSVNHLRSHKNLEIQKKARSLVDTWKKRVEAEIDAKAGANQAVPWPARSRLPEVTHGGNRHSGVSAEVAMKSSVVQISASKVAPAKHGQGEVLAKSASMSPVSTKSAVSPLLVSNISKEGQPRNNGVSGVSDLPTASTRDERSSSSSQSHNNSQSCSSDHTKTGALSGKEDARSSTAGSINANKTVGCSSRHRKSMNGFMGPAHSGAQRETGSTRSSSLHRNPASEKSSQSGATCEKAVDVPIGDSNSHKLIVKIPNRGRSPAQSVSGGSEDPSVLNSRASSPVLLEKPERVDNEFKEKNEVSQANIASEVNIESWQSNDLKEVLTGSDEGDGSPSTVPDEENLQGEDARKLVEVAKAASSSSGNENKSRKLHEASYGSINALIESCAKYSEANASMPMGDDGGMNLLASVAAGEMSKSDMMSPTDSPQINSPLEHTGSDAKVKSSPGDEVAQNHRHPVDADHDKRGMFAGKSVGKNADCKGISFSQETTTGDCSGNSKSSTVDVQQTAKQGLASDAKIEASIGASLALPCSGTVEKPSHFCVKEALEEKIGCRLDTDSKSDAKEYSHGCFSAKQKVNNSAEAENRPVEGSLSHLSADAGGLDKKIKNEESSHLVLKDQKPRAAYSDFAKVNDVNVLHPPGFSKDIVSESVDEVKFERADETDGKIQSTEKPKAQQDNNTGSAVGDQMKGSLKVNEINEQHGTGTASLTAPGFVHETEQQVRSGGSKLIGAESDENEECTSTAADAIAGVSDMEAKVEFDLNEGFNTDEGKGVEANNPKGHDSSAAIQLINPLPLSVSSVSTSLPASITVAAAAKRPFVPPDDLLKNRGELGWKGSAATSAFRPAEPRKALDAVASMSTTSHPDAACARPSRPALDFDLNVPDERILEDLASQSPGQGTGVLDLKGKPNAVRDELAASAHALSSGRLDLDLNRVDEPTDMGNHLMNSDRKLDVQIQPVKLSSNGEVTSRRGFDLNNGPLNDEVGAEPSSFVQHTRNPAPSHSSVSGLRMNNPEMGNFSSWFPQGNPYQSVTIQSMMPDRGDQSFPMVTPGVPPRMLAPSTGSTPFSPDVYRGPVLSSSPAVPFPSAPFQYPVFPFGTNFTLPSASFSGGSTAYVDSSSGGLLRFPAVHSQVLAPGGALPSHYSRPGSFVVSLPDSSNNSGIESSRKWGRQGLDLNAGPLGPEIDAKDDTSSLAARQLSAVGSQALVEEQSRMYHVTSSSVLKRKEPEGGWEGYKQSSWQ